MKYDWIIWDFNGTLFEDVNANVEICNSLLTEYSLPLITKEHYKEIFGFPVRDFYLRMGFNFDNISFEELANVYFSRYLQKGDICTLQPEVKQTLEKVAHMGINQAILSALVSETLYKQTAEYGIDSYFTKIMGITDIYAKSKLDLALDWVETSGLDPKKILFIGDTDHDYEVSQAIGCDCILYDQGHQSHEVLSRCNVPVIHNISEIINYI